MRVLTCLLLMSLFFSNVAVATQLVTMNPRLFSKNDDPLEVLRQQDQASKSGAWNYPAANVDGRAIRLPAAALEKQWLFGSMIEASTSAQLRIASGASMKLVRFSMEQGKLVLYECSPNVEVKPGVAEHIINRYSCKTVGDELVIDLTNSDFRSLAATFGSNKLKVSNSGGLIYDVQANEKHISWVEKVVLEGPGLPSCTVYVRFFFQQYEKSETYEKRVYTEEDQQKFGFFLTKTKNIDPSYGQFVEMLVNRIDTNKEIVYYLHPSIPEEYREACKEGILTWNEVFEAACAVRPIRVELGEDWMLPSDIRYRVIYWFDIAHNHGGAYGPSTTDPLTGEIIDGDVVIFGGSLVAMLKGQWSQIESAQVRAREKASPSHQASGPSQCLTLSYGQGLKLNYKCNGADPDLFASRTMPKATERFASEEDYICQCIKGVLSHEIGHTIGLRHNFSATADLANIPEGQIATSIMDYADYSKLSIPGVYDYAAIAYAHQGAAHLYEGKNLLFHTDHQVGTIASCNQFDEGNPVDYTIKALGTFDQSLVAIGLKNGKINFKNHMQSYLPLVETLRKYVGAQLGHDSQNAECFLLSCVKGENSLLATINGDTPAEEVQIKKELTCFQQYVAGLVLFSGQAETLTPWNSTRSFPQLSLANKEVVSRGMADLILNDNAPYELKIDTIDFLVSQGSSLSYSALKSAKRGLQWKAFKQFVNVFKKTEAQVKHERKQLQMYIKRALLSFAD